MIEVERFPLIYPPRPKESINPESVSKFGGYLAQFKYDDIRAMLYVNVNGSIYLRSRKREPIVSFDADPAFEEAVRSLDLKEGCLHLLDGGVMRRKLEGAQKPAVILWDILVHENRYLLGTTYAERYALLRRICGGPRKPVVACGQRIGLEIAPGLWLAPVFRSGFARLFERAKECELLEGIILKQPAGKLRWGVREENNGDWQVRVRKTTGRHVF
jgi:ATP-dependent DNA ligase